MRFLLLLSFFIFTKNSFAQNSFSKTDSIAESFVADSDDNIDSIAIKLTVHSSDSLQKLRALFTYVASHIRYDVNEYERRIRASIRRVEPTALSQQPEEVLRRREAVCEGYSLLLEALCSSINLPAAMVTGEARIDRKDKSELHGWNAVFVKGAWHLIDVTWAAGAVEIGRKKFQFEFNDEWFDVLPSKMLMTHYPDDAMWQLNHQPVMRREFYTEKVLGDSSIFFSYNDTIQHWMQLDSVSQLINQCERILRYNPNDEYAQENINSVLNNNTAAQMNAANEKFQLGVKAFNEVMTMFNSAAKKRSIKSLSEKEKIITGKLEFALSQFNAAYSEYDRLKFDMSKNESIRKQNMLSALKSKNETKIWQLKFSKFYSKPSLLRSFNDFN